MEATGPVDADGMTSTVMQPGWIVEMEAELPEGRPVAGLDVLEPLVELAPGRMVRGLEADRPWLTGRPETRLATRRFI